MNHRRLCLVFFAGCLSAAVALEPWQQLGPRGASAAAVAAVPGNADDVVLVTSGFPALVYYSTDSGESWELRDSIPDRVAAVAGDPTSILVLRCIGRTGRFRRSTNGGKNWSEVGGLPAGWTARRLVAHPSNSSELWALAETTGAVAVLRTLDGGATWASVHATAGSEARAEFLAIDPAHPARVFYGGSCNRYRLVMYSPNSGAAWFDLSPGIRGTTCNALAVAPADSGLLVCATDTGIYRTTNSGTSWQLRAPDQAWTVRFAPFSPYPVYATADNAVLRSVNLGLTWSANTTTFFGSGRTTLEFNSGPAGNSEFYLGNGVGLLYTTDAGLTWTDRTAGLAALDVDFAVPDPHSAELLYAAPAGSGLMRSTDKGQTWTRLPWFYGAGATAGLALLARNPDTLLAVTELDSSLHLYTAGTWSAFPIAEHFEPAGAAYDPLNADTVFAWGAWRDSTRGRRRFCIRKSADRGQTWSTLYSGAWNSSGACRGFDPTGRAETLYAWGSYNDSAAIWRSTNRGANWTRRDNGLAGTAVRSFTRAAFDTTTFFCVTDAAAYRSLNAGLGWSAINLPAVTCVLPDTAGPNAYACGTDSQGVFLTTNSGVTWLRDTIDLACRRVLFLARRAAAGEPVVCVTAGGSMLGHGVIGILEPRPGPAPARSRAWPTVADRSVRLAVVPYVPAAVELFTPDGRLVDRQQFVPVTADYAWTRPAALPAGAYLLRVQSGATRSVAKLVLR